MKLTNDQIERYKGQINLKKINIQGQIKLKKKKDSYYRSWWYWFTCSTLPSKRRNISIWNY